MLFGKTFAPDATAAERAKLARELDLRNLAHLGDAVFDLYVRERRLGTATVNKMHTTVVSQVNSKEQARLLQLVKNSLSEAEADIVRRARNLKTSGFRRNVEQSVLRQATAFEALVGYLYLIDLERLESLLDATMSVT